MYSERDKSQTGETQDKTTSFAECTEQMMSACGPEMKKWIEACALNLSEACFSCCDTQSEEENTEQS